jgi:hypothetical protein
VKEQRLVTGDEVLVEAEVVLGDVGGHLEDAVADFFDAGLH